MSDYTIIQLARLEKYKTEFIDYIESITMMAKGFRKEIEKKYNSLTPEEQDRNKEDYDRRLKFFDDKITSLENIVSSYRRIVASIKRLSRRTEEAIRVHTAVNVVKDQFADKKVAKEVKKAYNGDMQKRLDESYNLDGIYSDIDRLTSLLEEQGLQDDYVGNKTISNLVKTIEKLAEEMNRTHSVDDKLRTSIEPKASITTEEKMRVLDEYERRVKIGEMNRIQTLNSRVLFAGPNFTPSRVMVTGEKSRAALVRISTIEKQIAAIDNALGIIATGRGNRGFDNTYLLLTTLRCSLEESLRKQIMSFKDDEIDLISTALGRTDSRLLEYAELYADLEMALKTDPNNLDKIAMLRVRLLQYSDSKKMSAEEIYEAIKIARNINKDREAAKGNVQFKVDLTKKVIQGLSKNPSLEERVLAKLKENGVIREEATMYTLSAAEKQVFYKQMRLEEEVENALEKFRLQKLAFDRSAVVYRQGKFSRRPHKR